MHLFSLILFLRSPTSAVIVTHLCTSSTFFTLLSWLPTFFKDTFPDAKVTRLPVHPPFDYIYDLRITGKKIMKVKQPAGLKSKKQTLFNKSKNLQPSQQLCISAQLTK